MDIVRCFIEFLLSILESMSQLLPRSSHSPPAQPQLSQSIDLESLTPVPVVARQNIEQRNLPINMDIVHRFKAFLRSILGSRSPLLPTSSHSPPTPPQPSQTTELESPTIRTPVPDDARQNIEQRNLQWQDIVLGFCFTSHSLAGLKILRCGMVQLCLDGFDCLTQLKSLEIGGFCEELNTLPSLASTSIQYSHISLEKVELYGWPKLNHLPDEIQHFTGLKYLEIYEFNGMEALSDWLGNLSSLQKLYLMDFKNLMYLPTKQAMGRFTKLETLEIINCPKLEERCAERSGTEWSKIEHIPNIIIMGNILKGRL